MKRFEFAYERILKVKKQLERLAEMEQARAAQVVVAARVKVDGIKAHLLQVSATLHGTVGQGVSPGQWVSVYEMSEHLGQQLDVAEQSAAAAEAKLATAKKHRAAVATEVEALASLRQTQLDQWQHATTEKIQEELQETTMRRWMLAQSPQAGAA